MLLCRETVTLVRQTKAASGDTWSAQAISGAYWRRCAASRAEERGMAASGQVRALLPAGTCVRAGDVLIRGERTQAVAGLEALAGEDWCTVFEVCDNAGPGRRAAHIRVIGR